jgi:Rieske 2Fe-2S family protein
MPNAENKSPLDKSLPSSCYLTDEFFVRERELIFCREWFLAGREEQLPKPGDYLVLNVAGESILVVRAKDGALKAHYNVCRHRGARLCPSPEDAADPNALELSGGVLGASGIRCPYHQWTYALDGKLLNAPYLKESAGLRKDELSLYSVGVETWGGFFFLNLSPELAASEGRTLAAQLGDAASRVRRYPLTDLRAAHRITYEVAANWKVILENYNECYHCGGVHPELCEVVPAFRQNGGSNLEWERGIPHREGAFTFTKSGVTNRAPFPGLDDDEKVRHKGELIYPNFMLSLAAEHVAAFTLWPKTPNRTRVECDFLFHPDEIANKAFNPRDAIEFWDLVNRQDWEICKRVQQGMNSRIHKFGCYAPMEDLSLDIRNYITSRIGKLDET